MDKKGLTPLHVAAQVVDEKVVTLLIKHHANVNARSNTHTMPLHMIADAVSQALQPTAKVDGTRILSILCENNADINAHDRDGNCFVHGAASAGTAGTNFLEAASRHGADLNAKGAAGNTPAHCAATCGCRPSLELLARKSADIIHCRNAAGYTPLMTAAQAGQTAAMQYLLDQGASYSVADAAGRSLVELSISWGDPAVIAVLRGRGAEYGSLAADDDREEDQHSV
jgi:ankyrin repeat protein